MRYEVYGLTIETNINFKELRKAKEKSKIDIWIQKGQVSDEIKEKVNKGCQFEFNDKLVWYSLKSVGIFLIQGGSKITIDTYEKANEEDIRIYTLGTAMGVLLTQRGQIAIHGGTVTVGDKGVTVLGDMGAGKSTLLAALRLDGSKFISDDVSVINFDSKSNPIVEVAYAQQKLCKDAMNKFGYDLSKYTVIDEDREKYALPLEDNFSEEPMPLSMLCKIEVDKVDEVKIRRVVGKESLDILLNNIYRKEIFNYLKMKGEYFKQCLDILKKVPVYVLTRPEGQFSVDKQIDLIKNTI